MRIRDEGRGVWERGRTVGALVRVQRLGERVLGDGAVLGEAHGRDGLVERRCAHAGQVRAAPRSVSIEARVVDG